MFPIRVDPKVKGGKNEKKKNAELLLLKECLPISQKVASKIFCMIMGKLEVEINPLHSEWPNLCGVLAILNAIGICGFQFNL